MKTVYIKLSMATSISCVLGLVAYLEQSRLLTALVLVAIVFVYRSVYKAYKAYKDNLKYCVSTPDVKVYDSVSELPKYALQGTIALITNGNRLFSYKNSTWVELAETKNFVESALK